MVAIFVAFMFVSLVLTDLGVQKWKLWQAARASSKKAAAAFAPQALWQVPEDVHISSAHTWVRPDPDAGLVTGVDSLIAYAMGGVTRLVVPRPGDRVTAGQSLFRLLRDGRYVTVPSALTGEVVAINDRLISEPGLLSSDNYGSGWVCKITPTSLGAGLRSGLSEMHFGEKAIQWLTGEFGRLGGFLTAHVPAELALGATSQDGGYPSRGCLNELDSRGWRAFEKDFLSVK